MQELSEDRLPEADGERSDVGIFNRELQGRASLAFGPGGGLCAEPTPHVPGIDFAGTGVPPPPMTANAAGKGPRWCWTGWRRGRGPMGAAIPRKPACAADMAGSCRWPGGLGHAGRHRRWGTAGFTVDAGDHGAGGARAGTGAGARCWSRVGSGGVGSVATAILSHLGYEVAARHRAARENEALSDGLLARPGLVPRVCWRRPCSPIPRFAINLSPGRVCIDCRWAARCFWRGCWGRMKYGGSCRAVGLAGRGEPAAPVIPFLLRGVNLAAIDSVPEALTTRAWRPGADRQGAAPSRGLECMHPAWNAP